MAGANSSCTFTMDEVLDTLDDMDEPIVDGSEDDLGMEIVSESDESDLEQRLVQK